MAKINSKSLNLISSFWSAFWKERTLKETSTCPSFWYEVKTSMFRETFGLRKLILISEVQDTKSTPLNLLSMHFPVERQNLLESFLDFSSTPAFALQFAVIRTNSPGLAAIPSFSYKNWLAFSSLWWSKVPSGDFHFGIPFPTVSCLWIWWQCSFIAVNIQRVCQIRRDVNLL